MRWLHLVFALLFALSAVLQYNDPDPLPWILVWGGAALVAAAEFRSAGRPVFQQALVIICAIWMATLAPAMAAFVTLGQPSLLFASMSAGQPLIEESREFLGLAIILVYALLSLAFRSASRSGRLAPR